MKTKLKSIIKNLLLVIAVYSGTMLEAEICKNLDKQVSYSAENGLNKNIDHGMVNEQITFDKESGQRFESDEGT